VKAVTVALLDRDVDSKYMVDKYGADRKVRDDSTSSLRRAGVGTYVLVTAARNEEATIERTLRAVIDQTIRPRRWVVVSDGSTDQTDVIVANYAKRHSFMRFQRRSGDRNRNFGSKVNAIRDGIMGDLCNVEYEFIGMLDADISFSRDYYEKLLGRFYDNSLLGIGGGKIWDVVRGEAIDRGGSLNSVGSAVQMFRRTCYEEIGGYLPLEVGGEDAAAEVMSRLHGWQVSSFEDLPVLHHRRTGTAAKSVWHARFDRGIEDYLLGAHPLFFLAKCGGRVTEGPYLIGSLLMGLGYLWPALCRTKREVPQECIDHLRKEQKERLFSYMTWVWPRRRGRSNGSSS
jgi:biofilm PGA synthesis N-glycosyltransferase PgaC